MRTLSSGPCTANLSRKLTRADTCFWKYFLPTVVRAQRQHAPAKPKACPRECAYSPRACGRRQPSQEKFEGNEPTSPQPRRAVASIVNASSLFNRFQTTKCCVWRVRGYQMHPAISRTRRAWFRGSAAPGIRCAPRPNCGTNTPIGRHLLLPRRSVHRAPSATRVLVPRRARVIRL